MSEQQARESGAIPAGGEGVHPFEPPFGELGQGPDELRAAGKVDEPVSQGMYLAMLGLMGRLKARRESMGLSLTDVSERSGMTRQAISRLENGQNTNPTMESVWRYAGALGAEVAFRVEDAEAWDESVD